MLRITILVKAVVKEQKKSMGIPWILVITILDLTILLQKKTLILVALTK